MQPVSRRDCPCSRRGCKKPAARSRKMMHLSWRDADSTENAARRILCRSSKEAEAISRSRVRFDLAISWKRSSMSSDRPVTHRKRHPGWARAAASSFHEGRSRPSTPSPVPAISVLDADLCRISWRWRADCPPPQRPDGKRREPPA